MTKIKFKKNTNYGNLVLDFDVPGEKTGKKILPNDNILGSSRIYKANKDLEENRKKRAHDLWKESKKVNKYPRPDHFWAYVYHCCNLQIQKKFDRINENLVISGHYLCIHQSFESSIGTQIFKYKNSKISSLWKADYLRNKYRKVYETRKIPVLNKDYKFIIKNNNKITKRFIKIINVSEKSRDCPNVFNIEDLL